jgi:hypothetical protein
MFSFINFPLCGISHRLLRIEETLDASRHGLTKRLTVTYADNIEALYLNVEVFKEEDKSFSAAHPEYNRYVSTYHHI